MKVKTFFWAFLGLALFLSVLVSAQPRLQEKKLTAPAVEMKNRDSFIKKWKLPVLDSSLAVARRDLFRMSSGLPALENQDYQQPEKISPMEEQASAPVSLLQSVNIAYLGMAVSGKKKVALLELDGQPLSLAEGEEFLPGLKLVSITPEEILIRDNKDNSRKIRLKETGNGK